MSLALSRPSAIVAVSLLAALHTGAARAQEPGYLSHLETLNDGELEGSFAEEPEPAPAREPVASGFDFDERPLAIGAMMGFGSPVGEFGAVVMYTLAPPIALGGGAGTNFQGPQLTAMATLRPFRGTVRDTAHALAFTPAWSTGAWQSFYVDLGTGHDSTDRRARYVVDRAHWFQADVSYELVTRRGFWLRVGWGLGWMLNPGDAYCRLVLRGERTPCEAADVRGYEPDAPLMTFSLVLGYAFST